MSESAARLHVSRHGKKPNVLIRPNLDDGSLAKYYEMLDLVGVTGAEFSRGTIKKACHIIEIQGAEAVKEWLE